MTDVVRRGRPSDVASLAELADRVFRPGLRPGTGMVRQFPLLYDPENAANFYWTASSSGHPASMIGTLPSQIHLNGVVLPVLSIGSVATLPEHRGQGLASQLLARVLADGPANYPILLISGDRGLYLRHGAVHFGDLWRVHWEPWTGRETVGQTTRLSREDFSKYAGELHRLYRQEPYRYARDPEQMAVLMQATAEQPYRNRPPTTTVWTWKIGGEVLAYAVSAPTYDRAALELLEYAGVRRGVLDIAATAAQADGYRTVRWDVMPDDLEFRHLLRSEGISTTSTVNHGTALLLNAHRLVDTINPLVQERTGMRLAWLDSTEPFRLAWVRGDQVNPIGNGFDGPALMRWMFAPDGLGLPMVSTAGLNYI